MREGKRPLTCLAPGRCGCCLEGAHHTRGQNRKCGDTGAVLCKLPMEGLVGTEVQRVLKLPQGNSGQAPRTRSSGLTLRFILSVTVPLENETSPGVATADPMLTANGLCAHSSKAATLPQPLPQPGATKPVSEPHLDAEEQAIKPTKMLPDLGKWDKFTGINTSEGLLGGPSDLLVLTWLVICGAKPRMLPGN